MNDSQDRLEWFKNTYRKFAGDITNATNWQYLENAAIYRKHMGDFDGAVEAMVKAISLTRIKPNLAEKTATMLNYLADMYLECNAIAEAETAIREAVELSRPRFPCLLGDNLWILAEIQRVKGEYREALASAEESRRSYQLGSHSYGVAQAEELIEKIKTSIGFTPVQSVRPTTCRASDTDESARDP